MNTIILMKWLSYIISTLVLIVGFLLFYRETQEAIGSFVAAFFSAVLSFISFMMLRWLIQVFLSK
jgi:hypothetical protein